MYARIPLRKGHPLLVPMHFGPGRQKFGRYIDTETPDPKEEPMSSSTSTRPTMTLASTGRSESEPVTLRSMGHWTNHIVKRAATESVNYVLAEIQRQDAARQVVEDVRANHRNLNRMMTLLGALLIGLFVTFILTNSGVPGVWTLPASISKPLAPYTFTITIAMDSTLAAYAYLKKY